MRANVHDRPSANMGAECAARHLGRETRLGMEETGYDDGFNSGHGQGSLASADPYAFAAWFGDSCNSRGKDWGLGGELMICCQARGDRHSCGESRMLVVYNKGAEREGC